MELSFSAETPLRALPKVGVDFADNTQLSAPLRVTAGERGLDDLQIKAFATSVDGENI